MRKFPGPTPQRSTAAFRAFSPFRRPAGDHAPGRLPVFPSISHRQAGLGQHLAIELPGGQAGGDQGRDDRQTGDGRPREQTGRDRPPFPPGHDAQAHQQADVGRSALGQQQADEQDQDHRRGHEERRPSRTGRLAAGQVVQPDGQEHDERPDDEAGQRIGQREGRRRLGRLHQPVLELGLRPRCPGRCPARCRSRTATGLRRNWACRAAASPPRPGTGHRPRRRRRWRPARRPAPSIRPGSAAGCGAADRRPPARSTPRPG